MIEEKTVQPQSGFVWLAVALVLFAYAIFGFISGVMILDDHGSPLRMISGIVVLAFGVLSAVGLFVIQPNEAGAIVLFGNYKGTVKTNGFFWRNPFAMVKKISLRARNLNGDKLKVNDKIGNPIEIAAVVVWRVENTAEALFHVDDYEEYVETQSEAAIRHLAGQYPYDLGNEEELTLRAGREEVNEELTKQLQERLGKAGVFVMEARISHLAYAAEIAGAMLRRQQAEAVIAARIRIVEGAVSMVEMALDQLAEKQVVELDEDRKATMVSNLLVVLCSDEATQPVVNTGSLYQ